MRDTQLFQQMAADYIETYMPGVVLPDLREEDGTQESLLEDIKNLLWRDCYRHYGHLAAHLSFLEGLDEDSWQRKTLWEEQKDALLQRIGNCSESLHHYYHALYCGSIAYEIEGLRNIRKKEFLYAIIETSKAIDALRLEKAHKQWQRAYAFEYYLQSQYFGQKRFSLEGLEALIVLVDNLLDTLQAQGVTYVALAMSHRGRLNVMAHIMALGWASVCAMFESSWALPQQGDVKYHVGAWTTRAGMHIDLFPNASHLESIDGIVMGAARSMQEQGHTVACIVMHGDGAFAGQGVVSECLNMNHLEHYRTGGVIHIILNNHIGFTTSPCDGRSTMYVSDMARGLECPIVHVASEDLSSVLKTSDIVCAYRKQYKEDVIIDLHGVRVHGHNESDDPTITHAVMYTVIKEHHKGLSQEILQVISQEELKVPVVPLERWIPQIKTEKISYAAWTSETPLALWRTMLEASASLTLHRVESTAYAERTAMLSGTMPLQWGCAEMIALMRVLDAGGHVRFMGQDVERGTFTERLYVAYDQVSQRSLSLFATEQWRDRVRLGNSPLSEFAAMAFEYGYALKRLNGLTIWQAQFGDFSNGAQIIIDNYIAQAYHRWSLCNNIVLLLPHGYEGQGAEHSSARIERFLQLAALHNMVVSIPSTPSQYYHVLLAASFSDRPSIILTPKSLLRHPVCVSSLDEVVHGAWKDCLIVGELKTAKRLIIASGVILYDLYQDPRYNKETTVVVSLDRLYPMPTSQVLDIVGMLPQTCVTMYAQYEPVNQGALAYIKQELGNTIQKYLGREASCVTASGSQALHKKERADLLTAIFEEKL